MGRAHESSYPIQEVVYILRRRKVRIRSAQKIKKSREEMDNEVPVMSLNYVGPTSKDHKADGNDTLILVGVDRQHKWIFAHMVPEKGHAAHTIKLVSRGIRSSGYT